MNICFRSVGSSGVKIFKYKREKKLGLFIYTVQRPCHNKEVIADYPDDCPYPSCLLLGYCEDEPIHIVIAQDKASGQCFIVTAYKPDRDKWSEDFRSRRQ